MYTNYNFPTTFRPWENAESRRITLAAAVFEPITKSLPRAPTMQTSPSPPLAAAPGVIHGSRAGTGTDGPEITV